MIQEDTKALSRNGDHDTDLRTKLQEYELELKSTKEHLHRLKTEYEINKHNLEMQEKQIKNQNRRHKEIEKVHRELMDEYEKQVSAMKDEIRRMKCSQEKLLKKFKAISTQPQAENSSKLLDAIGGLEKLIRSNDVNNFKVTEKEPDRNDFDEALENCLHGFEKELQQIITNEETSTESIHRLEEKLKIRLNSAKRFTTDIEQLQNTLRSWDKQNEQEITRTSEKFILPSDPKPSHNDSSDDQEEFPVYFTVPPINWDEIVNSEVSFKENIIEDQLITEFQEKISHHLKKLETVVLELCKKEANQLN